MSHAEFDGERAKLYEEAISTYPDARQDDIGTMLKLLDPQPGEKILEIGCGNGHFAPHIQERIQPSGKLTVVDPSKDQMNYLLRKADPTRLETIVSNIEDAKLPRQEFDKVWSFGAFHHCKDQTKAMKNIYPAINGPTERIVICDVFQNTPLSRYFDTHVARYSMTGHEVKFLSEEFARTVCELADFKEGYYDIRILDLPLKWKFPSRYCIGKFTTKLHGLRVSESYATDTCTNLLGVEFDEDNGQCSLNWPMKALIIERKD